MAEIRYFGIRHHGPGSAHSLLNAFAAYAPDCVLIEGPPEADALLAHVGGAGLVPPVALLSYCPEQSALASFHPFAEFSPEWQAVKYANAHAAAVRMIDLPMAHVLALQQQRREAAKAEVTAPESESTSESESETGSESRNAGPADADAAAPIAAIALQREDPLDAFARAAGYGDGESWWNHMVEERGDGDELFAAIEAAMTELRASHPEYAGCRDAAEEAAREAHMRLCIRDAGKQAFQRIAVVCGAWHVPALRSSIAMKQDQALLKSLPKAKVATTWIPWTFRHLTRSSGYGAGIVAPGWYEHLFRHRARPDLRVVAWLARVARVFRERDLDCSSAHLIEATRLADALAALAGRPAAGLDEIDAACRSVLTFGDAAPLRYIDDALKVGDRLGRVPEDVPTVPLARDLEAEQKRLRLKPEATQKTIDLDLRNANDLARSRLLHRLNLLRLGWGELQKVGRGARGTFHEIWSLQWQPEFALDLIEASRYGQNIAQAANVAACEQAESATGLAKLAELVDAVLLADLPAAVTAIAQRLEARATQSGDALQLLQALPPLANVFRYGNVRNTDASLIAHVLDGMIVRAAIALPLAASDIDVDAAAVLRDAVLAAHTAIALRDAEAVMLAWRNALRAMALRESAAALLRGLAYRLRFDDGDLESEALAEALQFALSSGADPSEASHWLEGFLNRNALVLLNDDRLFGLVDTWLSGLHDAHFIAVLPLVRRTFAQFEAAERRDLGARAALGASVLVHAATGVPIDLERAALTLPMLRELMGLQA